MEGNVPGFRPGVALGASLRSRSTGKPLQKVFYTNMFLKQFSVSTKKERQIKQLIVEAFSEL